VDKGLSLNYRRIVYAFIIESLISAGIILISLHTYIFGNGFYNYGDTYWNPATYRIPLFPFIYNGSYNGILGFGQEMVTWVGILLMNISDYAVVQDKIFTIYTFVIFLAASWVLSEMLYRILDDFLHLGYSFVRKEMMKVFLIVAIYCNIAIMNLNVDAGTYTDGFIMLLIAITIAYSLLAKSKVRALAVATSLLSLSVMIDPDYYLAFTAVLFFSFLVNYRYKVWERFALPVASVLLSLPSIFYFVKGTIITATGVGNPLAVRSIFYAAAYGRYNPFAFMLLVAHNWSTYAISPPSILLLINRNVVFPFFGDIVLLPKSFITDIWVLSLALYPLLSFTSLLFKSTRRPAMPFVFAWLTAFFISQWWRIPYLNDLFYRIASLPLIGPAFGTAVSLPGHYMNIMAISEAVLIFILIINVWSGRHETYSFIKNGGYVFVVAMAVTFVVAAWYTLLSLGMSISLSFSIYSVFEVVIVVTIIIYIVNILRKKRKFIGRFMTWFRRRSKVLKIAATVMIVFIVLFSGWQAFDGSFFPPRSYNSSSEDILTAQSLANSPFSPQYVPDYVVNTYSALSTISPSQTVFIGSVPNYHLTFEADILYEALSENYSSALPAFLATQNIRYIITYRDSPAVMNALNESGIEHRRIGPSSYLYVNNNTFGNPFGANLLLNYSNGNEDYLFAYKFLESMNIIPVISDIGEITLGFNTLNERIDILPSSYFLESLPPKYFLNSTPLFTASENITLGSDRNNLVRNDWYMYDNSTSTNVSVYNGMMQWDVQKGVGLSVNYGNVTAPGYYTMIPIGDAMNVSASAKITFQYKVSSNFKGNISTGFGFINYSPGKAHVSYTSPASFPPSQEWKNASYSFAFPQFTGWFSPLVNVSGTSGAVYLRDINVSWGYYKTSASSSPYASKLLLGNTSVVIPKIGKLYLEIYGNGTFDGKIIKAKNGLWISPDPGVASVTGDLLLGGAVYVNSTGIRSLLSNYTVYDIPYSKESRLNEDGHHFKAYYTITGQEVFLARYSREAKVILLGSSFIIYGFVLIYIFIVLFPLLAIIGPTTPKLIRSKIRHQRDIKK
jgi:hypothetical protein